MRRLYFFDKQFNYKDVIVINNFNPIVDIISTQSFKIETPLMPVVDSGDICILKDNSAVVFIGNVLNVEESEKKTKTITISYIDELFNINGEVADLSGNIITWITNTLTTNFISVGDNLQKISLSIVNNCSTAYSGTYTFESENIKDCLRNIFNYSGVYVDFDIDFADNGSIDSLICNIRSNVEEETIKLKYNMPIISEIKRTVTNSQNVNKLVLLPDDTVVGGNRYEFYLLKDGTISTDAENVNRFENVKQDIKYYASDFSAESLLNTAKEVLGGEQFNHSIGFFIKHNSSFNIGLYKKVIFYDKESVVYNSIITKIQYGTEFDYVELGVVRLKLTDKLQKKDTKTATSSTSSGGGSYVLPQATGSTLGGIIAETKTTETNEVKIDTATGKLYASGVGSVNMDNVVDGETYVKTENNLSDTLKSNYDTAYTNTHTHSNKALLDNTTASYTTDEQTKLGAISGTNTGDETASTIKTKLGITTLSGSNTGDQTLPVNSDFTLSGLSEKNFSSLTNKPTTISGYGITDAYTKTETDTKYAHSLVLSGTSLYLYNNLGTPTALSTLTISDSSSASAISTNARLVTERDIYYGLPNINGSHSYTSSTSIYAPTSQLSTSTSKRYIIGASSTTSMATENTNASCYMQSGVLYSNNLATLNTGNISTVYNNTDTQVYSSKYVEDNFAQMLYTTPYYANKTATTTADLTSTIPTLSASNYLTSTTTNTAFNWTTPNFVFTNTLTGNLSLQASSLIYLSLPFSISLASQTVNFGYRVKVNGVAISSNQTFGAVAYTGGSGHTDVNRVYLQCTTDSLTEKTIYTSGDAITFEVFTQQATSTSMTTRAYCGVTIGEVDYYTFNELTQFRSQLSNATPTEAGIVYGQTSNINTNTSFGYNSSQGNTGYQNTVIGNLSGHNAKGNKNTFVGYWSGYSNSGNDATFIGNYAGVINTGKNNTAVGSQSMLNNTGGANNTAIGYSALLGNQNGSNNAILGNSILTTSNSSLQNSIVGSLALGNALICNDNAVIGYNALYYGGNYNVSIGSLSGRYISDGLSSNYASSNNVYIGYKTMPNASGETNQIIIGYNATGHGSNTATWGNTNITNHYFTGNVNATGDISIPTGKTLKINNVDALATKAVQPYIQRAYSGGNGIRLIGTYNYSTSVGDTRPLFYMVGKQGHGNGTNYLWQGEFIFGVATTGAVTAKAILKVSDGTYGKFYYRHDTVNKILYLYIYTGQYSSAYFSDLVQINAGNYSSYFTLASAGSVTGDTVTEGINILYPSSGGEMALTDASNLTSGNVTSWQNKLGLMDELWSGVLSANNSLSLSTLPNYNFIFCFFRTSSVQYSSYSYADLSQNIGSELYFQANSWGQSSTIKIGTNRNEIYLANDAQMPLIKVYGLKL